MPTYEYACKSCGEHHEVVQAFTDDALTTCPRCGGPLRKVFGNIAIAFKGSGFYKTDNRSMNKGTTSGSKDKEGGSGDSESKPAAAAESGNGSAASESTGKGNGDGSGGDTSKPATPTKSPSTDKSPAPS